MVKRSLASVARPLANLRVPAASARQFSSSPAHGLSAIFAQTENTKLNEALGTIQEKIILPAYLPPKQRELVFNPKMRSFIQQNPVVIELDGLEHKFTTIDRFSEIPNSKKALTEVLELMETKEDWDNLGTLLAGYKKAGIRLQGYHYDKIIRKAGQKKQSYAIIECAKQSDKTGLFLTKKNHLVLLLSHINKKITSPSGEANESAQALKWIELVLDLIQRPEHLHKGFNASDRLHLSPVVRGLVLFAQASSIKAQQAAEGSADVDVQPLKDNVVSITSAWARLGTDDLSNSPVLASLNPRSPLTKSSEHKDHLAVNFYILTLAQNIKGTELAQEILGDAAKDLAPIRDALEQHLKDFIKADSNYIAGWADTYESVTGRKPEWSV
ncbi:hypothetical protein N0V84_005258 [Fusarium piperis]|uniref:Uncharacterized protein n=1 Tax=Fusarium piperis TaxID=1435070 RepID=A0A9W9BPF7_9HYPO|nr:hypothetical protein N0V84_005258 [Fusarium piperis]